MSKVRTKKQIKKIVSRYAEELKKANFNFFAIYLFGSCINGKAHKWSDIDVAVVSDQLRTSLNENENLLWHIRRKVDSMIEPHGFAPEDFQDACNPMASEIKKTGIRIV